ncbi:hypothetical protein A1O7_07010 [Cladophialophora yegresii CBS 114405]|uniref:Uncharacterized protein n=1 Tax=Cladophialophora yegresii CBS 114405 TaxID=1182544 RepID=W9VWR1_9EURO|nr:uncharacterized protein A1O7_07010 [Cladophialophora yegresii CBS 114405]EXJ56666.1 hypothetical protein A1O7_07010 [Cladophialophora yegresii CBS 114405]
MSKPKAFLKQSKSKKKVGQALDTADDFQAAGVDFEEAAGKWRAGDGAKSLRFFCRAIEVYDRGLQKFPASLDLAYNKARILLEIATHPLLVPHLERPLLEVLHQALEAHRYALQLDQDNPDSLFNAAQVLTAIAEAYARDGEHADQDALQPLEEALELQDRCLSIQELKFEEYIQQQNEAARIAGETPVEAGPAPSDTGNADEDEDGHQAANNMEDRWFSVVEPVTKDTLVDTILAQLGTLTTLCSVLGSSESSARSTSLAWIEEHSSKLIQTRLPILLENGDSERLQEVALARANFVSELLKAGYSRNSVDPETYKRERDEAFRVAELGLERSFAALMANANSLVSFNTALAEGIPSHATSQAASRWSALSAAIANLATASKLSDPLPDDIADTHFIRGNCSLLQHQLGQPPASYTPAVSNSKQLLKNAETFYRNASKLYQDGDQKAVAQLRASMAQALQDDTDAIANAAPICQAKGAEWIKTQLEDMVDDGLISPFPSMSQICGEVR